MAWRHIELDGDLAYYNGSQYVKVPVNEKEINLKRYKKSMV